MQKKFGADLKTPNDLSVPQYEGVYLYKAAVEKAGSTDADKVIAALSTVSFEGPRGMIKMNKQRHAPLTMYLGQVQKDGAIKVLETFPNVDPRPQCPTSSIPRRIRQPAPLRAIAQILDIVTTAAILYALAAVAHRLVVMKIQFAHGAFLPSAATPPDRHRLAGTPGGRSLRVVIGVDRRDRRAARAAALYRVRSRDPRHLGARDRGRSAHHAAVRARGPVRPEPGDGGDGHPGRVLFRVPPHPRDPGGGPRGRDGSRAERHEAGAPDARGDHERESGARPRHQQRAGPLRHVLDRLRPRGSRRRADHAALERGSHMGCRGW